MAKKKRKTVEEGREKPKTSLFSAAQVDVTSDLLKRLERDLKRNAFKVLTPYTVAQSYEIRISAAKKLLREAANRGLVVLYSGGRAPIYIKKPSE